MSQGQIVQCIGAVVDIQFPRDSMPKVYDALKLMPSESNKLVEQGLTELHLPQVISFIGRGLGHLLSESLRVALQREPSQAEIDALLRATRKILA